MTATIFKNHLLSFHEYTGWTVGIHFISQLKWENSCSLKRHQSPNTHLTVRSIPWSILMQWTYIMSRYSVALLFLCLTTNSSNNSASGLHYCVAGLTKPTWKDSGRHNHFTSSASSSSLWSCCFHVAVDHYSKGAHCCPCTVYLGCLCTVSGLSHNRQ